jgi:predicted dehydrogenase
MSKSESLESGLRAVPFRSDPVAANAHAASVTLASASSGMGVFKLNRRSFLVKTALGTAAALIAGKGSGVLGANDAVRIGVVGLHGRGQSHIYQATRVPGFRLAALCDVDPAVLGQNVEKAKAAGHPVRGFKDVRDLIASNEIDAITIATPNHWHALATIWACQAGKDVFVEKPVSHNVSEGRQMVEAARRYGRMVQAGTQARAHPELIEAVAWVRAGNLGKIRYARGTCYKPRMPIGKVGKGVIPPGLDYDLWTGPAPLKPLTREKLHYDWHWIYDYGNGDLGNQGVHEVDIARWFLGYSALAPRVISLGGRLGYDDDGQTPNTQLVCHAYDGPPLVFEVRGLPKSKEYQASASLWGKNMDVLDGLWGEGSGEQGIGVEVVCEGGRMIVVSGGYMIVALDPSGKVMRRFDKEVSPYGRGWGTGDHFHWTSWLEAIRTRDHKKLTADILEGHISSSLCHTALISHRLGERLPLGRIRQEVKDDPLLAGRFGSFCDHLARNGMDLEKQEATLGARLALDAKAERFVGNAAADALLTRADRAPFLASL